MEEFIYAVLLTVAEGNPGAITVVTQLLEKYPGEFVDFTDKLVSLSCVGSELWVKYKDCGKDIACLAEFLRTAKLPTE
jgi:hypothetical protein